MSIIRKNRKIGILVMVALAVSISLPMAYAASIAVTYPPNVEDLSIEGDNYRVEMAIYNHSENNILIGEGEDSLQNIEVEYPQNIEILPDNSKTISILLSSEKDVEFSGRIRYSLSTDTETNVLIGASMPLEGKFVEEEIDEEIDNDENIQENTKNTENIEKNNSTGESTETKNLVIIPIIAIVAMVFIIFIKRRGSETE